MQRSALVGIAAVVLGLIAAPTASAGERAIGLVVDGPNQLVEFDTSTPDFVVKRTVTGVAASTRLEAIDLRPSDGKIYGVARKPASEAGDDDFYTYEIDPDTAVATLKGGPAVLGPDGNGLGVGMDFDPTTDQIRLVKYGGTPAVPPPFTLNENGRINPDTGALVLQDTALNPTPVDIRSIAYDRSDTNPGTATTLYGIDKVTSSVVRIGGLDGIPSADGGVVTTVAPLGVTFDSDPGFDISPLTGDAYASLGFGTNHRLYRISLIPGAGPNATLVGDIDDGDFPIGGLTILPGPGPRSLPIRWWRRRRLQRPHLPGQDGHDPRHRWQRHAQGHQGR